MAKIHSLAGGSFSDNGSGTLTVAYHIPINHNLWPEDQSRTSIVPGVSQDELTAITAEVFFD